MPGIDISTSVKAIDPPTDEAPEKVLVESHWNRNELVKVEIGGKRVTVRGDLLKRAITNAMNKPTV